MYNSSKLNLLSLFSGCGGMDLGFEGNFDVLKESVNLKINKHWNVSSAHNGWVRLSKTRFQNVFANDIKHEAKRLWLSNFSRFGYGGHNYQITSIVDLVKNFKKGDKSVFPSDIDIVTGGFPCQDFSVSGKRLGFNSNKSHTGVKFTKVIHNNTENRGMLYLWMKEVIALTCPKIFVAENVKGLTNISKVKEIIEKDFSNIGQGYIVIPAKVIFAADYGVPQRRERIIFYGFNKEHLKYEALNALTKVYIDPAYDPYPVLTHSAYEHDNLSGYVKLRTAFKGLEEPEISNDIDQTRYSRAKYMGHHCQGQIEINLDGTGPTIRSEHHGNIEFRRLSKEHGGKYAEELAQGMRERRLTIRECARIQTFPDDFHFILPAAKNEKSVSMSEAYKLIGNALPPFLAYHIAKRLEDNWELYFK